MKVVRYSSFVQIFGRDGSVGEGSVMVNDEDIPQLIASLKNAQQSMHWTAVTWCKFLNFIGDVVLLLRRQ
jgi:hypothetical protein